MGRVPSAMGAPNAARQAQYTSEKISSAWANQSGPLMNRLCCQSHPMVDQKPSPCAAVTMAAVSGPRIRPKASSSRPRRMNRSQMKRP